MQKLPDITVSDFESLLAEVRACKKCEKELPLGPRPVIQLSQQSRILLVGQAPGKKVHETGLPFNDPSGDRLRDWMGIDRETFYNSDKIALLPMGFCFPGTGKGGDLPPRPECRQTWRLRLLEPLKSIELTVVMGRYAIDYHLGPNRKKTLTDSVKAWRDFWPALLPLPHPSPRNNRWLRNNPWVEADVIPRLKSRVKEILDL